MTVEFLLVMSTQVQCRQAKPAKCYVQVSHSMSINYGNNRLIISQA